MATVATVPAAVTGAGGPDFAAAVGIIADRARANAAWSRKITATLTVSVAGNIGVIEAPVEPGYVGELRKRHPLFGNREFWYGPPGHPFLLPAAYEGADAAMARYAQKIDAMARRAGFK